MIELIAGLAMVAGFVVEWRRANQSERITALEGRVAALEGGTDHKARISAVEATLERLRRNV